MNNEPNNQTPDLASMPAWERRLLFSAAKTETVMPDHPVRRPAPRARRHSVRHRAIR